MLYTLFFLCLLVLSHIDESYEIVPLLGIGTAFVAVVGVAHVILITVAVARDTAVKKLSAKWVWGILTFIGGLPIALFYAMFTHHAGKYNDEKGKRKNIICAILSVLLCVVFVAGMVLCFKYSTYYENTNFPNYIVCFENSKGEKVIYDKMGNEYTAQEKYDIKYYDREGNSYSPDWHYGLFSSVPDIHDFINDKTGEIYTPDNIDYGYNYYIDKDGYLVVIPDDEIGYSTLGVYYTDNGDIYYSYDDCYWLPDGNLEFYGDCDYSKITYDEILNYSEQE
jgi:hypothetical protein